MINLRLHHGGSAYSGDISPFSVFWPTHERPAWMLLDVDEGGQEPDVTACDGQGKIKDNS